MLEKDKDKRADVKEVAINFHKFFYNHSSGECLSYLILF